MNSRPPHTQLEITAESSLLRDFKHSIEASIAFAHIRVLPTKCQHVACPDRQRFAQQRLPNPAATKLYQFNITTTTGVSITRAVTWNNLYTQVAAHWMAPCTEARLNKAGRSLDHQQCDGGSLRVDYSADNYGGTTTYCLGRPSWQPA